MNFISSRRSTRIYKKDPIPHTIFKKLITSACYAPSGGNCQNWEFSIITRPETLKEIMIMTGEFYEGVVKFSENKTLIKLSEYTMPEKVASLKNESIVKKIKFLIEDIKHGKDSLFYGAPCLIVVHADKYSMTPHDNCCYALYNIVLMAHSMGIGSCINGFVTNAINGQKKMREKIGIPETNEAYAAATLGYPKYEYHKIPLRRKAKTKWF
jgi:nitroreductase